MRKLKYIDENGKSYKIPSDSGLELGIASESRVMRDQEIKINLFTAAAQKYIAENALKILDFK
jgi:hypothetical protein